MEAASETGINTGFVVMLQNMGWQGIKPLRSSKQNTRAKQMEGKGHNAGRYRTPGHCNRSGRSVDCSTLDTQTRLWAHASLHTTHLLLFFPFFSFFNS